MEQNYDKKRHLSSRSTDSFFQLVHSGKISKYKDQIIKYLGASNLTRRQLTKLLKAGSPSNLCAPLKELENEGVIKIVGSLKDPLTNREVSVYGLIVDGCQKFPYISIGNLNTVSILEEGNQSKFDSL